jgi:hypothetical protein
MIDLIKQALSSPAGSFGFVFSILILAFLIVHWVTKKVTCITKDHSVLSEHVKIISSNIHEIGRDISYLKGNIDILNKPNLAQSHSPISLTEIGKTLSEELQAEKMIIRNWDKIFADLEKNICNKNAYDIQQYCIETAAVETERFLDKSDLEKLKEYAYIKGNPLQYYSPIFGIIIRDKYLEIKGIKVSEVDKYDPNKK